VVNIEGPSAPEGFIGFLEGVEVIENRDAFLTDFH